MRAAAGVEDRHQEDPAGRQAGQRVSILSVLALCSAPWWRWAPRHRPRPPRRPATTCRRTDGWSWTYETTFTYNDPARRTSTSPRTSPTRSRTPPDVRRRGGVPAHHHRHHHRWQRPRGPSGLRRRQPGHLRRQRDRHPQRPRSDLALLQAAAPLLDATPTSFHRQRRGRHRPEPHPRARLAELRLPAEPRRHLEHRQRSPTPVASATTPVSVAPVIAVRRHVPLRRPGHVATGTSPSRSATSPPTGSCQLQRRLRRPPLVVADLQGRRPALHAAPDGRRTLTIDRRLPSACTAPPCTALPRRSHPR